MIFLFFSILQDTVESVLAEGVDVNGFHGTLLPLHCACMAGDVDCVKHRREL